ncbi:energy-coupling factor transporter ATPase [Anoxybacterium hadale]|uniref:Energy-coupling factor transporter ATPase n=1 Tax=Anoxybacterium hadale TaxID=3408580 RepID=A0ACD1AGA0_9FIRM|nr:energy-coupling factor transporter ATPase [Clostridiales bacterium]
MNEMIKIDDLVYQYRREDQLEPVYAVNHVSIDVKRGSFTAIIGKNGSGKSTLAKNINALLLPSGGAIYVKGYNTTDESKLWEIRQAAGMVFQNPDNQLVSTIVEDDVAFGPENLGIEPGEIRRRVDDSLYAVNMYEERKKAPHLLSGGQKQRIAIAGVIAMRPECIILDEPTAMLDPHGRAEVMEIIEKLNREGITILLITHFMDEAARADRVIIMEQGRVILDGTPEEVYGHAEEIKQLGLDVPFAVDVAHRLRKRGIEIPGSIIGSDDLADYIAERAVIPFKGMKEHPRPNGENTAAATDGKPVIEVKNLTHIYSEGMPYESAAIKDISFRIERGSFVGIIGHTGSGKSTLIQHLNGLLKPKSGSIVINDIDITARDITMREIRRKIGLVFQYPEYQLFEETVHKDVAFGPLNLGLTQEEADKRVVEAIGLVGLNYEEIAQRSPFELSGGQKRRVAIAGVIAMKPQILILDEPTAGLDPKAHADILKMIETIHTAENISILLVSHNMGDIARLADKVLVLDRGRLALMGTPTEVFANADRLETLGLGLPPAAELMKALRERGIEVSHDILTIEAAEEELHLLMQNRK